MKWSRFHKKTAPKNVVRHAQLYTMDLDCTIMKAIIFPLIIYTGATVNLPCIYG